MAFPIASKRTRDLSGSICLPKKYFRNLSMRVSSRTLHLLSKLMILLSFAMTKTTLCYIHYVKDFFYFSMWTYSVKPFSASSHWQADSIKSPTIIMFTFFFFEKLENSDHLRVFKAFTLAKINLGKPEPIPWSGKKKKRWVISFSHWPFSWSC